MTARQPKLISPVPTYTETRRRKGQHESEVHATRHGLRWFQSVIRDMHKIFILEARHATRIHRMPTRPSRPTGVQNG